MDGGVREKLPASLIGFDPASPDEGSNARDGGGQMLPPAHGSRRKLKEWFSVQTPELPNTKYRTLLNYRNDLDQVRRLGHERQNRMLLECP